MSAYTLYRNYNERVKIKLCTSPDPSVQHVERECDSQEADVARDDVVARAGSAVGAAPGGDAEAAGRLLVAAAPGVEQVVEVEAVLSAGADGPNVGICALSAEEAGVSKGPVSKTCGESYIFL